MENMKVLTEDIRYDLIDEKDMLAEEYKKTVDVIGDDKLSYEEEVYIKMYQNILESEEKNILSLVILNDAYEFAKTEQIKDNLEDKEELKVISFLETESLTNILKKLEECDDFLISIFTLFFAYHSEYYQEDRDQNRAILKATDNLKHLNKFLIAPLDVLQYEYNKRRI